jgi:BolA protein
MMHRKIKEEIENILQHEFSPTYLEVIDDSHKHARHPEAMLNQGAGHFTVVMKTAIFDGVSLVKRHRLVYGKLLHMMDKNIHALSLKLLDSHEQI